MGIMTSYGSYNDARKPIILDNMVIAFGNSLTSFIAGFAVWSVVGYLQSINSIAKNKTSSMGLAFIAYPTAIDSFESAPNFWALLLGITLFLLGIDSAFSMVEATSTVICDTRWGSQFPRMFVAFVLCLVGFLLSLPFCTNFGFILFDVIDYYLSNGLLIIVGLLQCAGVGWGFDASATTKKSEKHANSLYVMFAGFWITLICVGVVTVSAGETAAGLITVVVVLLVLIMPLSFYASGMSLGEWYNEIFMCGVKRIGFSMSAIGRKNPSQRQCWEGLFVFYWGVCVKYICNIALWFIFCGNVKKIITSPYEGYSTGW